MTMMTPMEPARCKIIVVNVWLASEFERIKMSAPEYPLFFSNDYTSFLCHNEKNSSLAAIYALK